MRFSVLCKICLLLSHFAFSQFEYGVKGGLNFDSAGKISKLNNDVYTDGSLKSESGFNLGVYAQFDLLILYLRPELQYTKVKRSFEELDVTSSRIELPISLGYKVLGPLSIFAGPSIFYYVSNKTNAYSFDRIINKFNFGHHLGLRLNLGNLSFDFRYEKGNSSVVTDLENFKNTDLRPNQVVLGMSLKLD